MNPQDVAEAAVIAEAIKHEDEGMLLREAVGVLPGGFVGDVRALLQTLLNRGLLHREGARYFPTVVVFDMLDQRGGRPVQLKLDL